MTGEERLNEFMEAVENWTSSKSLPKIQENETVSMILNMKSLSLDKLTREECLACAYELYAHAEYIHSIKSKEEVVLDPSEVTDSLLERMPSPTGWRILVLPYRGKATTEGGLHIPTQVLDDTQIQTVVGYVLKLGNLAYKDEEKFPNGAWCKEKDWIIFPRYAGSRFRIDGGEVRLLNDDEVLASIKNPDDIVSF